MVTNQSQRDAASMFRLGARVDRATATLPQTAAGTIFTISGGRVMISMILGEVTVVIQTQLNNTKLKLVPTVGSTVDLCAVKDITALEVGGKLVVNGVAATALTQANAGAIIAETVPVICAVGNLQLDCSASNTGSIKWSLWYVPVDDGALVVAA
jgi:hypothetical protein